MKGPIRVGLTLLTAAVLLPAPALSQQTGVVSGRVVEAGTLRPIPDATVIIVGTGIGARTNDEGVYRLTGVATGPLQLRATRIGFAAGSQSVSVSSGETQSADFQLATVATQLDVVVTSAVTGEAQRRREVGANVGNIAVSEVEKGPIVRFSDVLTGRTAGVSVQATAGTVGTSQRIRIRGANSLSLSNEPLIYIDGANVTNSIDIDFGVGGQAVSRLNDISPDDIENIEVLKGPAATAIYGTAAANGVLLITTKRGRVGTARWNAYAETGTQKDKTDYPANYSSYRLATPGAPLVTAAGGYNTAARPACFNEAAAAGTCTRDSTAVFNTLTDPRTTPFSTGRITKAGVNVGGGTEQARYYLGLDQQGERGVISFNTMNRLSMRANLNANLLKTLDFSLSSGYTRSKGALPSGDNSVFSPLINGFVGSAFFLPNSTGGASALNYRAFTLEDLANYVTHQDVDRFTIGGVANWRPLSFLIANANVGLDYINRHDFRSLQPNRLPIAQSFTIGTRESTRINNYLYTGTGSLSANFDPTSSLHSRTTFGASYNRNLLQGTTGTGAGIVEGTENLGATSSLFVVDEDFLEVISLGGFLRQEFSWEDRIFLSASLRRDKNSAFGTDFGFITYPGVNASWVLTEEPWFPQSRFFSNLRLRAAYGESGQRPNFRNAVTFFTPVSVSLANAENSAVTLGATGNLTLRPELSKETEFGGDVSFLNDRLSLEFTHFSKRSSDALISIPLAPSFGLTNTVLRNLGGLSNRGNEVQADLKVFQTEATALNIRGTATTLKNKIELIGTDATGKPLPDIIINRGEQRHRAGFSAGSYWQRPVTYNDANSDGLLARSEVTLGDTVVYLGDAIPKWNRSISADLTLFKFLRLSTLVEARGGNKQLNASERFRCASSSAKGGCSARANPNSSLQEQAAFIASAFGGAAPSLAGTSSALYIEDGSFTKWRELSVTLQAPDSWRFLRLGGARGASVTLAGKNLKTWTNYSGIDPEIVEAATSNFNQSEFNTQPSPRYYTLRFNLNF